MRLKLFEITVQRLDHTARAYVVAQSQDEARLTVIEHERLLGLNHQAITISRFDVCIDDELLAGLDDLLENAPVGFASFADRWIPHIAPVQQLKLFRTIDDKGANVFAIAPNVDVALAVFAREMRIPRDRTKLLLISDGMADLPPSMVCNLPRLLEFGPIGAGIFDVEDRRWFVA